MARLFAILGFLAAVQLFGDHFAHGEGKSDAFTIGEQRDVGPAFICTNKEAAETVAKLVVQQGIAVRTDNQTVIDYVQFGICGVASGTVIPREVLFHGPVKDIADTEIKVILADVLDREGHHKGSTWIVATNVVIGAHLKEGTF